ncbi:MAG: PIG-L family deacetylase [Actinobacteria bacterium]|nr:MAG: PIG-L family deacetylase [Actinomycetota bacterium]
MFVGFASALVLFAHPDDAEYMCGGTVAHWAGNGTEVHYVVVTDGSAGSNEPGMTREQISGIRKPEQDEAARVLGVRTVTFLDFPDGMLEVNLETRMAEVLVAPDPSRLWFGRRYINHADHRAAGELALCAVMPDAPSRPQFPELLEAGFEPYEVPNLWLSTEEPDTYVDITKTIDLKMEALTKHRSQGVEDDLQWVRDRAKELGEKGGVEYAEGFLAFSLKEEEEAEGR